RITARRVVTVAWRFAPLSQDTLGLRRPVGQPESPLGRIPGRLAGAHPPVLLSRTVGAPPRREAACQTSSLPCWPLRWTLKRRRVASAAASSGATTAFRVGLVHPRRPKYLTANDNGDRAIALPTIFEVCVPRDDVLRGTTADADFAADLAQVLRGTAPREY